MWFKNRRAKCRQQLQHQTSSSVNSSKSSGNSASTTRHSNSSSNNSTSTTNSASKNASTTSGNSSNKTNSNPLKTSHHHSGTNNTSSNNNNSSTNNNNTGNTNGLGMGHNPSPILPMTPSTSVSPPINVICKKEITYHNSSNGSGNDSLKTSAYDSLKDSELGLSHHASGYANINSRLQQSGGNLTPLGSNSSIMTTPSPPITPQTSHNPLAYVPNHESYNFWHNQYNQYPNNYNASYYTQMDYFQNQSQSNYNMGHSGYSTSNFGLTSGSSLGSAMGAQAFSPNLDYMSPQDKYVNMV